MYSTDNEANKSTGESSTAQIKLESDIQERKRKANREAVARSKQRKIQIQNDLEKDVNDLEVKKALMSHQITSLEEEVKVLRDNKELKIHVDRTKDFEAEITRLKTKLEYQKQMINEFPLDDQNLDHESSIDQPFNPSLETPTNEFPLDDQNLNHEVYGFNELRSWLVATGEQQPNNILFHLNHEFTPIDPLFNPFLETPTNEFSLNDQNLDHEIYGFN